jgi:cytochrome b involved in lipid metabolism
MDPCLQLVSEYRSFDPDVALQFLVKFTGLAKKTPVDRFSQAIAEEVVALCRGAQRALESLRALNPSVLLSDALGPLLAVLAAADAWDKGNPPPQAICFPRRELEAVLARACESSSELLARELSHWIERHRALEHRIGWLLRGTSTAELERLDPVADCDRIYHAISSSFRVEGRVLELLSINRIAQSSIVSTFFRSTKEAEQHGVSRFYDTWSLLANYFEWGADSERGAEAAERMRQIHGRYYIPNAGMKYVLLETAFTFIDGIARIGHRPLLDVERRGYFHAHVKLGLSTNIGELSHDYDEMYEWYRDFNLANAAHHPLKRDTFETLVGNSMTGFEIPGLKQMMLTAGRVAMDETYLNAVDAAPPTPEQARAVRAIFFTLGQTLNRMPYVPFVRSLQNNPAKTRYTRPSELGVGERSPHMPSLGPAPNGGFPEWQRPVVSASDIRPMDLPPLDWDEIRRHDSKESLWVVIDGEVYDLTVFAEKHPGGLNALLAVAGRDASAAFAAAGHSAATQIFRLNYRVGRVATSASATRSGSEAPRMAAGDGE